jgi:hypothetical protein
MLVLLLSLFALGAPSERACDDPDKTLFDAVTKLAAKDYEAAIAMLDNAESCPAAPDYLARVQRTKGLAFDALNRRLESLLAFHRALGIDPSMHLREGEHSRSAIRLFSCAASLGQKLDDIDFRLKLEERLRAESWTCPDDSKPPPEANVARSPLTDQVQATTSRPTWPIWTALGVGLVGATLSAIFSVRAVSLNNDSKTHCEPQDITACTSDGVRLRSDARTSGNIATVFTIVGALGAGTALTLWLLRPSDDDGAKSARLDVGPSAIFVSGAW